MSEKLKNFTLRQLRALSATLKYGSLTAAGEKLGVTQPAVTLQLQNLQDLVGLPLIQRTPDGITVTQAGQALLLLDERITLAVADCIQQVATLKGLSGGRVAIGAVSTGKYFVPAVIGAFARRYRDIDLKLTIGNRAEIMQGLRDFSLDIAITGRPPEDMDLERRLIGAHPHVIIAAIDHALTGRRSLDLKDLAGENFVMREPGSGTRSLMQRLVDAAGFQPKIGMEIDSNETIKQAVMAGLGVAFISAHTVALEIEHGQLALLDVTGLPVMREWFVVRRRDKHLMPPALALLNFIAHEAGSFLPHVRQREAPLKRP